jgi:phosphohistidine phosphatase
MAHRRLVLVRHAKAAAGDGDDAARPLEERGTRDAAAVGRWLADHHVVPDRVVVSPARRARETWEAAASTTAPSPVVDERVYANTVHDLLAVVRETPSGARTLVVVGHNPSMAGLAAVLDDGHGDRAARRELAEKLPTSGVVVFAIDAAWTDVADGAGRLVDFAAPRG